MQFRELGLLSLRGCVGALLVNSLALGCIGMARAQTSESLRNVVQLAASGQVEVNQDWLQMTLGVSREASSASVVQKQLQQSIDAALRTLKPQVLGQEMQVHSGSFGVYPRQGSDGKIKGWQGRAELVLEGRNFARISQAAAMLPDMTVSNIGFGLSKEGAMAVQDQAQALAVENFKARAAQLAKQFGFANYSLREVAVNSQDTYLAHRVQRSGLAMAAAKMDMTESVPVEPGKTQVTVNVSGSVQLH